MTTSEEKKSPDAAFANAESAEPYLGVKFTQDALNDAARAGDLSLVRHLIEHGNKFGLKPTPETMMAAGPDKRDILHYLIEQSLKSGKEATQQMAALQARI